MQDITPEQARDQLVQARSVLVEDRASRRVHGLATAAFGLAVGCYVAVQQRFDGIRPWDSLAVAGYVLVLVTLAAWQARAARVVPRRSRFISRVGLAGTVVLVLPTIVVLNIRAAARVTEGAAGGPESLWALAVAAVTIALPMLVAGLLIRRGGER
jgi:uncharacterized membrane protein